MSFVIKQVTLQNIYIYSYLIENISTSYEYQKYHTHKNLQINKLIIDKNKIYNQHLLSPTISH